MHYFLGAILLLFLFFVLPASALVAITVFFVVSALIVQTSASLVTKTKVPFSLSIKAVIYALFFTVLAVGLTIQFAGSVSAFAIFLLPVLIFIAQTMAYNIALEVPLAGSALISVCIMVVGWLVNLVFGLSFLSTFHVVS